MAQPRLRVLHGSLRTGLLSSALTTAFLLQMLSVVRQEVMTNDEGYHTYAGYRYWQCADFGVNPEHPPLAKLVAALPLVFGHVPSPAGTCPVASTIKGVGYGDSDVWYYGSSTAPPRVLIDTIIWHARLAMSLFALTLAVVVFFFTRRLFGDASALLALTLLAFEPTLIAHGPLVTTDMALSAMSLLAVFAFYLYQRRGGLMRVLLAGLCCGLTLCVKHSGILIVPVLLALSAAELVTRARTHRDQVSKILLRQAGALVVVFLIALGVLWATYIFRYAARPGGATLTLSLTDFLADTTAKGNRSFMLLIIPVLARFHLLPEAYLYGFVDVLSISNPGQSSFLLGHLYPHGVPQYFPTVVLIKSTFGMLALGILAVIAALRRQPAPDLRAVYPLALAVVWMLGGMGSTLNIGYRHVLPIIAPACCLIGAATLAQWRRHGRAYRAALVALLTAHVVSSLASFPNEIAYANEAFGGVQNTHNLLTDSNNDWSQALPQLADWLHLHNVHECWFAYDGLAHPAHSGISCHLLIPNLSGIVGPPPPLLATGTFVVSGLSLSGIEWERPDLNPYATFQASKPVAVIGGADMVYQGSYDLSRVLAVHQIVQAMLLNADKHSTEALPLAQAAVQTLPTSALAHLQLANALAGLGRRSEAHAEYKHAASIAEPQADWYFLQLPEIRKGLLATQAGSQ